MAEDNLGNSKNITQELIKQLRLNSDIADEQREIRDVILDQTNQLKFQKTLKQDIRKATKAIYDLSYDVRNESDKELGTARAKISIDKQLEKVLKNKLSLETDIVSLGKENNTLNHDLVESLNSQIKAAENLEIVLKQQQGTSQEIRKNFGVAPFQLLSEVMERIGGKASIISEPFADAAKSARESVIQSIKQNKKLEERKKLLSELKDSETEKEKEFFKLKNSGMSSKKARKKSGLTRDEFKGVVKRKQQIQQLEGSAGKRVSPLMKGFKSLGAGLGTLVKSLTGLLKSNIVGILVGVGKFFVDAMFGASKQVSQISRDLGVSKEFARETLKSTKQMGLAMEGPYINAEAFLETQGKINEALGLSLNLATGYGIATQETVFKVAQLSKKIGLNSQQEQRLLSDNLKTEGDITEEITGQLTLLMLEEGFHVGSKDILKETLSITGTLRANFKGNTAELAKAVYQAKLLGFNLKDLEGIQSSLLDFQSSIEAELEAELLTGKQLNLEKARSLALDNDLVGMAQELNKQNITYSSFSKMNMFARQATAKSLGMEVNQMSDVLQKQEDINKLKGLANQKEFESLKIVDENGKIQAKGRDAILNMLRREGDKRNEIINQLGEDTAQRLLNQNAQDKFNEALDRAKGIFTQFIDGGYLDTLADSILTFAQAFGPEGVEKQKIEEKFGSENISASLQKEINSLQDVLDDFDFFDTDDPEDVAEMRAAKKRLNQILNAKDLSSINTSSSPSPSETFTINQGQKSTQSRNTISSIGGTNLDGGKGSEKTQQTLERILLAVEQGQNISVDGNRLNTEVARNTSKFGA